MLPFGIILSADVDDWNRRTAVTSLWCNLFRCRVWPLMMLLTGIAGLPSSVFSEDWMFRRSYYSHVLPEPVPPGYPQPVSRSAYRGAYYRDGFGVRTTYRVNNHVIQNGNRVDWTFYREGWVEFPQLQD